MKLSLIPVSLALKIFYSQIAPILLYGADVWGAYSDFNFENWDRNIIERTHTQFLKRILGCDTHSPNLMARTDLGKRPLLCDIINRFTSYIKHHDFINGTMANSAYSLTFS